jgi:hypothetical protein
MRGTPSHGGDARPLFRATIRAWLVCAEIPRSPALVNAIEGPERAAWSGECGPWRRSGLRRCSFPAVDRPPRSPWSRVRRSCRRLRPRLRPRRRRPARHRALARRRNVRPVGGRGPNTGCRRRCLATVARATRGSGAAPVSNARGSACWAINPSGAPPMARAAGTTWVAARSSSRSLDAHDFCRRAAPSVAPMPRGSRPPSSASTDDRRRMTTAGRLTTARSEVSAGDLRRSPRLRRRHA